MLVSSYKYHRNDRNKGVGAIGIFSIVGFKSESKEPITF